MPIDRFNKVKLLRKEPLAHDVLLLSFEKPAEYVFTPGQYAQIKVPDADKLVLRSYSLASSPDEDVIKFCVKIMSNGLAGKYFSSIKEGDVAEISLPLGIFVCEANHYKHKIFIATGAGLAPFMSMIPNCLANNDEVELIFGLRTEENIFNEHWVKELQAKYNNFKYLLTLSRPSESWIGKKGRVTEHLTINHDAEYYICGSLEMVKDVRKLLTEKGADHKRIHLEIF